MTPLLSAQPLAIRGSSWALAAVLTSACGDASSPGGGADPYLGACRVSLGGEEYCQEVLEYRGNRQAATLVSACAAQGGMYLPTCPSANRAGRCTVDNGISRQVMHYYGPSSADMVRPLCTSVRGTFEAG